MQTKFVVDTNIIVHWLLKPEGLSAKIIESLELQLYTPYKAVDELWKHKASWSKRRPKVELHKFVDALSYYIEIVYPPYDHEAIRKAQQALANVDPDDTEFLAVALMSDAYIWSYDEDFKKQNLVRVVNSRDILEMAHEIPTLYLALENEYLNHYLKRRRAHSGR